jgi:peroxiredoxin
MNATLKAMANWILGLSLLALAGVTQAALKPGDAAPDFSALDSNGKKVSLTELRGQYVVLEWTNHECPFVKKHYDSGNMQALQKTYTGKGYRWYSIISSAPGKQGHVSTAQANELTASRNAAPTGVILDESGTIGKAYDARTSPHMFIINPEGKLVYLGGIDDKPSTDQADIAGATQYVKAAFDALEAGRAVAVPVSQPYGCSVKY